MKVVSWNVNSVRARWDRLLAFLDREQPDVVCLQEIKVVTEKFPAQELEDLGYRCAIHGQKTFNGVAILSTEPFTELERGMAGELDDDQARLISVTTHGCRIVNAYVPNGGEVGGPRYPYKLDWLSRFEQHLRTKPLDHTILCGDMNITVDDRDAAQPERWLNTVLCDPVTRERFGRITSLGFCDLLRDRFPEGGVYTWWDYRQLAFPKGNGVRIDYILATADMSGRIGDVRVDRDERKGKGASDHAPLIAVIG